MEENELAQGTNTIYKDNNLDSEERKKNRNLIKQKNDKTKIRLIVVGAIIVGVVAIIGIIVGILAARDDSDGNSCPAGEYKVCGIIGDGEETCGCYSDPDILLKPIIYLYPEEKTEVTIRLGAPERLTSSYPKYIDGWSVVAHPNGDLIDRFNGNRLYSLYWEGKRDDKDLDLSTGFVVKSEDTVSFLEEKLNILGLNYKEKEEFIVYWLPKLEANKYNYIYFATEEEINAEMPLEFSVQPDTIIRVGMIFKGLDEYKNVEEQALKPAPERNGFTVVEWGGTELQFNN